MSGIFISRGMAVGIPKGGLSMSVNDKGEIQSGLRLHVHFDVCPTWLEIALVHLKEARVRETERNNAWEGENENLKGTSLEREFESSMQSCMACAIALDAFYALIKEVTVIPEATIIQWRAKRTPRYAQISEVLRQAFKLRPELVKVLRQNLKEIFRFRDLAVHPRGKIEEPLLHPELNVGVEWRFAYFRYSNALLVFGETIRIIRELSSVEKINTNEVERKVRPLMDRTETVFTEWEKEFTPDGLASTK